MLNRWLGMTENASEHGAQVDHLLEFAHWFMLLLFVGWTIFFICTIIRFRSKRNPQANYYGVQTRLASHLEIGVVITEAVLLFGFAFPLWAKQAKQFPRVADSVQVRAVGQQFGWNFHYPGPDNKFGKGDPDLVTGANPLGLDYDNDPAAKDDIVTFNEMHVPLNKPAIVYVSSKDVIHNYAIAHMRVSQDAIPGTSVPVWFKPVRTGEFEIICAQLCGLGHYNMKALLVVDKTEDYDIWLKEKAATGSAVAVQ
jgi:cytochrome c oxidase subunit 2